LVVRLALGSSRCLTRNDETGFMSTQTSELRQSPRLGRVEAAILDALSEAGGCMQRDQAREHVYPTPTKSRGARAAPTRQQLGRQRANAEAGLSRAIVSLERKGLIVREHNVLTGRTTLRRPQDLRLPEWEETARAEEDLAAHCLRLAAKWSALARRSQRRAAALRVERFVDATEAERRYDLDEIDRLQGDHAR
jgi:DNA-binding MarR family transcriptional regulator